MKTEQSDSENHVLSFGERLYAERKKQNLTVADVAKAINLSEQVIDAIERSDVECLPQPAFVQGYLRAYAKYLDISENTVLEDYAQAVPRKQEADLQPRSMLPGEASSNTPFVKMITITLLLGMVLAALYASFGYYKNALEMDKVELEDQTSLSLPETDSNDQTEAEIELPLELDIQVETEQTDTEKQVVVKNDVEEVEPISSVVTEDEPEPEQLVQQVTVNQKPMNQLTVEGDDALQLSATQVSWVEVDDVNNENLYYALLEQDQSIKLQGVAPFKIFLGNAPQVKIKINDVSVNIEKYIRSNNVAHFRISVDQQQIVFH